MLKLPRARLCCFCFIMMGARWQREMSMCLRPLLQGRLAGAALAAKAGAVLAGKELEAAGPPEDSWQLAVPHDDEQEGEPASQPASWQHAGRSGMPAIHAVPPWHGWQQSRSAHRGKK